MNATLVGDHKNVIYKLSDHFSRRYGHAFHILMTKMSATMRLKLFGERAEMAIIEEFKQLVNSKNRFEQKMLNSLTTKQLHLVLCAITLVI